MVFWVLARFPGIFKGGGETVIACLLSFCKVYTYSQDNY